jgi:heme oxygenase
MRLGSRAEHEQAEEAPFVADLLAGRVDQQGYAEYLLRLRTVYDALEGAVRAHADDPAVAAVHDPDLERVPALDADLDHWLPDGPRTVSSPAVTAYRDRLAGARAWGPLLAAHHYTRYLGDLSGGQAIGRVVDRAFGRTGRGVAFYDFPAIPRPKPYKDAYRARLDALDLSPDETARVVDEVRAAFRLNQGLFAELADSLPA